MSAPLVYTVCAWCDRTLRAERWPETPGVRDGDVSHSICAACAEGVEREACDFEPTRQPPPAQPWGLRQGIAFALSVIGGFVAFGLVVRMVLA